MNNLCNLRRGRNPNLRKVLRSAHIKINVIVWISWVLKQGSVLCLQAGSGVRYIILQYSVHLRSKFAFWW